MITLGRVMQPFSALVLCTSPDNALYLSQALRKYLKGSLT